VKEKAARYIFTFLHNNMCCLLMIRSNARATTRNGLLLIMLLILLLSLTIQCLINICVIVVAPWHHNC
jgi:hypothetical protein